MQTLYENHAQTRFIVCCVGLHFAVVDVYEYEKLEDEVEEGKGS